MVLGHTSIAGYDSTQPNRYVSRRLFNSKNFAESASLAEVCALLRAILVINYTVAHMSFRIGITLQNLLYLKYLTTLYIT